MSTYSYTKQSPISFDETVAATKQELATEGFGVLSEIDVQKTLQEKIGSDLEPYLILGACHAPSAADAIAAEREVGLLLPCNVIVYAKEEVVYVSAIDPETLMAVTDNDALTEPAADIKTRLTRVVDAATRASDA